MVRTARAAMRLDGDSIFRASASTPNLGLEAPKSAEWRAAQNPLPGT